MAIIGGTGGIGQALAKAMAADGANVTVVGRTFRDAGTENLQFMKARRSTARWHHIPQHSTPHTANTSTTRFLTALCERGRGASLHTHTHTHTQHVSRRRTSLW